MQQRILAVALVATLFGCKKLAEQNFTIKREAFKDEKQWKKITDSLYNEKSSSYECIHYLTYDSAKAQLHIKYAKDECENLDWVEHYLEKEGVLFIDTVQVDSVLVDSLQQEDSVPPVVEEVQKLSPKPRPKPAPPVFHAPKQENPKPAELDNPSVDSVPTQDSQPQH